MPLEEGLGEDIPFRTESYRVTHSLYTVELCMSVLAPIYYLSIFFLFLFFVMQPLISVQQNVMSSHFIAVLKGHSCFSPGFLAYLVSGSWSAKQCQVSIPSRGVGLKSHQILVGSFHKHCAIIALAYLVCRAPLQLKEIVAGLMFTFLYR